MNHASFEGVYQVGDVMQEAAMFNGRIAESESTILEELSLAREKFALVTIHRAESTDDVLRLRNILDGLADVSRLQTVVWPVHPRTRKQLSSAAGQDFLLYRLRLIDPVSYRDMLMLEKSASVILTDSGDVQKEAMWFGVPCLALQDETEWVETIAAGRNELAGCQREKILAEFAVALLKARVPIHAEENGIAPSTLIVQQLLAFDGEKAMSFGSIV